MSFEYNNKAYPGIYNADTMNYATNSTELFSAEVNAFINQQTEKLPFKENHSKGQTVYIYQTRSYCCTSVNIDNSINTGSSVKAKNERSNQVLALIIAGIVAAVGTYLAAKYTQQIDGIKEDMEEVQEFKAGLPNIPGHKHLDALHKITNLRLKELNNAKTFLQTKLAITVVTVASAILLGIAALAAPELMVAGAIATGLSLLAGIFTWTYAAYDRTPQKIAEGVRDQLNFLKQETIPAPLFGRVYPTCPPERNQNDFYEQPADLRRNAV